MKLKIATLNFSGINTSPFEYYDGTKELQLLNQIYKINLNHYKPGIKAWQFKRLDPTYTQKRQSVVFDQLELGPGNTLPNKSQWWQIWKKRYDRYRQEGGTYQLNQNQIQNAALYDYIIYITICEFIYQDKNIQQNFKQKNPQVLLDYLKKMKNRPSSISQQKGFMLLKYLQRQNLDILFLQEASSYDWQLNLKKYQLGHYKSKKNSDSVIIYKKYLIGRELINLQEKYGKQLNFNQDSVSFFSDKGYLLISAHLKSNKEKNQKQIKEMLSTLQKTLKQNPNLKLIIGIDANNFIQKVPQTCKINLIPLQDKPSTTIKKRTSMQEQLHKADDLVSQVKDHIITNLLFEKNQKDKSLCHIQKISGRPQENQMLPNDSHPYDHLVIKTKVIVQL